MKFLSRLLTLSACFIFATATFAAEWKVPRTTDGYPDLQGVWTNSTLTNFERPTEFGDRLVHTEAEVAQIEKADADGLAELNKPTDPSLTVEDLPKDCGRGFTGVNCGYNSFWVDPGTKVMRINGEPRTSMITKPANGKMPAMLPPARERLAKLYAAYRTGAIDGPEQRALGERCIMSFGSSAGPPMLPLLYNNNYQIVQNKDYVMILVEMVHDVRIIRLNGQHNPSNMLQWMGSSIGRYEGDTLVVETTGFRDEQTFRGSSPAMKVIEKFTRVSADQIKYEFEVSDPSSFVESFAGELAFNHSEKPLYEYACHEGNYALPGILAGQRRKESVEVQGKK